jgi:basic membrane protein A
MKMRKARRVSTLFHIAFTSLAIAACTKGTPDSQQAQAPPPERADKPSDSTTFRVALLTPGPISDQSWNGGAYKGLMRIRDSLGATVSHIQTKTPAEFEEQFRQYGAQGYDLVFGHGFEFQDAAKRVGPDFPRTIFVTTSGSTSGANVAGIEFAFADASYLAGLIAGSMTKSNVLGVIGGTELPPVKESFEAFTRGAKTASPNVKVLTSYIGNWDDVSADRTGRRHHLPECRRSRAGSVSGRSRDTKGTRRWIELEPEWRRARSHDRKRGDRLTACIPHRRA